MKWVYAAYTVTWVIVIAYIIMLTVGFRRVRDDIAELPDNQRRR